MIKFSFFFFLFFSACNQNKIVKIKDKKQNLPSIYIENFQQTKYSEEGKLLFRLFAKKSSIFLKDEQTNLNDIHIFQYENEKLIYEIKSEKATFDNLNQMIILEGKVSLKADKNRSIFTEYLRLDMEENNLYSDKKVSIQSGDNIIKGTGLKAKKDLSSFTILNPSGILQENSTFIDL